MSHQKINNMKLLDKLFTETESLKVEYLEKVKEWTVRDFNSMKNLPFVEFIERIGGYYKKHYGKTKSEDARFDKVIRVLNNGLDKYIEDSLKSAELHYTNSILKLNDRILKKEMNLDKLIISNSSIGININTTITDGEKSVNAFTIVASGEIQKPHYRYLIR